MKARMFAPIAAVVAALLVGAVADPASAALSRAEAKCRDTIAKGLSKYAKMYFKVAGACHEERNAGERPLADDCNDSVDADDRGRLLRMATKFRDTVGGRKNKCFDSEGLLASQYPECPPPAESVDDGGPTTGIDSFSELADCLLALTNATMEPGLDAGAGNPTQVLDPATSACQQTLASSMGRVVRTILKERRKCQRKIDRQGVGPGYACEGADPNGKIGRARVRLNEDIERDCSLPQSELAKINACSDTTVGLRSCVGDDAAVPTGDAVARSAYILPGGGPTTTLGATTTTVSGGTTTTLFVTTTTVIACGDTFPVCDGACPSGTFCTNTGTSCQCEAGTGACAPATIFRTFRGRLAPNTPPARSRLSTGWSGTAHNLDIPDNTGDAVDVVCDANCENCSVTLNPMPDQPQANCRCDNNPQVVCDTIGGPDPDDCGAVNNNCTCFFGAPLDISSGGTPVCVVNQIANDYSGTMNLRTGEWFPKTNLVSLVFLGLSQFSPCPRCNGDDVPNDGVRNGTCDAGLQVGQPCDENGRHDTFGPVSYDCPPPSGSNVSGDGLKIDLDFTTGTKTVPSNLPCDNPEVFGNCPCRVCSGDNRQGCTSDEECAATGAGTCTAGGGAGVQPNACDDLQCGADGLCENGPIDTFCDGALQSDGTGYISCITDADCAALGVGTCSIQQRRSCFPDPISLTGSPDTFNPVPVAIFCIPPTTSAAVNSSGGLPGPGTFEHDFVADIRCLDDPNLVYEFPDGQNCPGQTTTTTTSTTLPLCGASTPPVCAGACPVGEACQDTGGACGCVPTTTTTLPPCGATFPTCNGECPSGQLCVPDLLGGTCNCQ